MIRQRPSLFSAWPGLAMAVAGIGLFGYFLHHTIQGDRGLVAKQQLEGEIATAQARLAELTSRRQALEHRVTLMGPKAMDRDLLEEQIRQVLGYAHPHEVVILTNR